jgi:hypothetical protein
MELGLSEEELVLVLVAITMLADNKMLEDNMQALINMD